MTSQAKVTIIINFLNAKKYLAEAVESVFSQTYPHWELLLVDDGSSDRSTQIARDYAERFPGQVRYLEHHEHRNLGKSSSRNLGIQEASGKYLVFLDADDVLLPQKLERQVMILETQPEAGMVYGRSLYWYSWTGAARDRRRDHLSKLGVTPGSLYQPPTLMVLFLQDGGTIPSLCSPLVRRECSLEVGGFDESIQQLYEDQVFLAKMCLQAPVLVTADCGEKYRQHPDSSYQLAIRRGEDDPYKPKPARLAYLNWLTNYLDDQGISDKQLLNALQKAYRPFRYPILYNIIGSAQGLADRTARYIHLLRNIGD